MSSSKTVDALLQELSFFGGKIYSAASTTPGEHDVIFLQQWAAKDLLALSRLGVFQVALYSEQDIDDDLKPFFDWRISNREEADQLKVHTLPGATQSENLKVHSKSALFLDRDGVVNIDHGYVGDPQQVALMPDIGKLLAKAKAGKKDVVVVTNQSGIGRDFYSVENFHKVMGRIGELLSKDGGHIDQIEYSPYHPLAIAENFRRECQFRKPRPGMIHRAAKSRGIDLSKSILIGDRQTDLISAVLAGVGQVYLIESREGSDDQHQFEKWKSDLEKKYQLQVMNGIQFQVIASHTEVKI